MSAIFLYNLTWLQSYVNSFKDIVYILFFAKIMSPAEEIRRFVTSYIKEKDIDEVFAREIPKKWEKYGDFVLFDERTFHSEVWKSQEREFWIKISEILKCKRIGIKNKIKNDNFRTPNVRILLGDNPWIVNRDNSIIYTWNVEKSMFSAGNACERHRIASFNCENEVVVDMFAGIGYFTLPYLVHAKAELVHAIEWNPVAVEALSRNIDLNKVKNKCVIYKGDTRLMCPKRVAHRVNLGLIPSSEKYWDVAVEALVENGGILHIHENVETKDIKVNCKNCLALSGKTKNEVHTKNILMSSNNQLIEEGDICIHWKYEQWWLKCVHILHSLTEILSKYSEKLWCCILMHVNFVKSYAPHVHHLVYDIKIINKSN